MKCEGTHAHVVYALYAMNVQYAMHVVCVLYAMYAIYVLYALFVPVLHVKYETYGLSVILWCVRHACTARAVCVGIVCYVRNVWAVRDFVLRMPCARCMCRTRFTCCMRCSLCVLYALYVSYLLYALYVIYALVFALRTVCQVRCPDA